jgi:hypothetical protein
MVMNKDNNNAIIALKVMNWNKPLPGNRIPSFCNH